MESALDIFNRLMGLGPMSEISIGDQFERAGILIDLAGDLGRDEGTARALEWCGDLEKRNLKPAQRTLLEYFRANAWANRQRAKHREVEAAWQWVQPETQRQIFHLRRALESPGFEKLSKLRRCQILTNLANQLNKIGRFVDALPVWGRAIALIPTFGMALGNRGCGLLSYAQSLYDPGHVGLMLYFAHKDLEVAISPKAKYGQGDGAAAKAYFADRMAFIETGIDISKARKAVRLDGYDIGRSAAERQYRNWALQRRLFLNPLNDLGSYSIAAQDILTLPDFTLGLGENPWFIGFFNQMKQEFVSGRWLLFDAAHDEKVHFSDRRVLIHNTLDYTSHSLAIEKMKAAFRIGYSLLDKIAFFLNEYEELGEDPARVYFKSIWYDRKKRTIRDELSASRNWPLRGLFWLSKDLFDPELQDVMEPDAQELYAIRNRLEHSYLKVHEIMMPQARGKEPDLWTDTHAYSIQRLDFEAKTLRVFRMARAGLIHLSLAMHWEERQRRAQAPDGRVVPTGLPLLRDAWKK